MHKIGVCVYAFRYGTVDAYVGCALVCVYAFWHNSILCMRWGITAYTEA